MLVVLVAFFLSPWIWFKQSPRQARFAGLRKTAFEYKIIVSLPRRPDARDNEGQSIASVINCLARILKYLAIGFYTAIVKGAGNRNGLSGNGF